MRSFLDAEGVRGSNPLPPTTKRLINRRFRGSSHVDLGRRSRTSQESTDGGSVAKRPSGAPGIYELEPGVFKVVASLGRDGDGRYRQRARTVRGTLRHAKAVRARFLTEAADGDLLARSGVTFGAERWARRTGRL